MARYKHVDMSPRLLPVDLESQLVPGSFAHAVHHLVDRLDLSGFDAHYCNDVTGATAHAPAMLLKAVLLGYSQGMVSSRSIERACRDNVLFIAITGDAKPHFTTIADFVSRSRDEVASIFAQVLTILGNEALIGREMFAIDGVKLPSNASKHRSGTRSEFIERAAKLERAAQAMLDRHRHHDVESRDEISSVRITARLERMTREAEKVRAWLAANPDDRIGPRVRILKSNLTDNESAKMATDKGVIQGYCGVAVVDAKHQIIVEASAHGSGNEQALLLPVLDACAAERLPTTLITADAGYHSEENLAALAERRIDALIADNQMRRRDERLADQGKHTDKPDPLHDKSGKATPRTTLTAGNFKVSEDQSHAICPAGHTLVRNGQGSNGDYTEIRYRATVTDCAGCALRAQCFRNPKTLRPRVVAIQTRTVTPVHTPRMRERIDSEEGRRRYGQRFATVEPVFGNLRHNKRLSRFTLRGQRKVDGQWKLFALVHNIEKLKNLRTVMWGTAPERTPASYRASKASAALRDRPHRPLKMWGNFTATKSTTAYNASEDAGEPQSAFENEFFYSLNAVLSRRRAWRNGRAVK